MAHYEVATDIGLGFNVFSNGRLIAWFLEESMAASLVERLNQGERK
jgi:hypothetical protein